ncbi:hypothetical protein D3C75_1267810 [compost metagenome]
MRVSCCWVSCRLMALVSWASIWRLSWSSRLIRVSISLARLALSSSLTVSLLLAIRLSRYWVFWNS